MIKGGNVLGFALLILFKKWGAVKRKIGSLITIE